MPGVVKKALEEVELSKANASAEAAKDKLIKDLGEKVEALEKATVKNGADNDEGETIVIKADQEPDNGVF